MIRFNNVSLKYRQPGGATQGSPGQGSHGQSSHGVHNITFTIPQGGFRWLTGPSGAGKTSILKLIYLAERASHGQIEVLGTTTHNLARPAASLLRRRIGVVYQDFRLLGHLSAYDNVALPLRLARRAEPSIRADVTELLHWVGLEGKLACRPAELSGGEQQRIAIARAVVNRPKIFIADEPTGNLDDVQAKRLMWLITGLNQLGTTVVVATHNRHLIRQHGGARLVMADGALIRDEAETTPESDQADTPD